MDSQHASKFFTIPVELRRAVYAHFLALGDRHVQYVVGDDGVHRFRLTPCTFPGSEATEETRRFGNERVPNSEQGRAISPQQQPIYMRRLMSSWGPHWMCEELACHFQEADGVEILTARWRDWSSALRVCKRMYLDLVDIVTTATDLHVTDLRTLKAILDHRRPDPAPFSFKGSDCPRITRVSITLSLPLAFFQAMETASLASAASSNPEDDDLGTWRHLSSHLLVQLPCLRKLCMWLDHNGKDYWSVVDERAILAPMESLKTSNPELELVCFLPKVHPQIEDLQRHYLSGDEEEMGPSSPLEIRRVLRQRYRVVENPNTGHKRVIYAMDFPRIIDEPAFDYMSSLAEKERFEAGMWRAGVQVDRLWFGGPQLGVVPYPSWLPKLDG